MKSAQPRQLAFVFADSPKGDEVRDSEDESSGKRFLVHTAKGSGRMEAATCATAEGRLMEAVASASNLAQALLNLLRNKGTSFVPCGVITSPAITGAVRVDSTSNFGVVSS